MSTHLSIQDCIKCGMPSWLPYCPRCQKQIDAAPRLKQQDEKRKKAIREWRKKKQTTISAMRRASRERNPKTEFEKRCKDLRMSLKKRNEFYKNKEIAAKIPEDLTDYVIRLIRILTIENDECKST